MFSQTFAKLASLSPLDRLLPTQHIIFSLRSVYRLTFALVPGWQRGPVGHRGGGEIGGGAVHLVGEGAVGQALLLVPLADEARQRQLVVGGEAGGVAEALGSRGAVLLDGAGLRAGKETGWTPLGQLC